MVLNVKLLLCKIGFFCLFLIFNIFIILLIICFSVVFIDVCIFINEYNYVLFISFVELKSDMLN